jgi:predicted amidophosphoribosyltransferase
MNATAVFVGLLIVLLTILLLHRTPTQKPQTARYGTQMICPSCGLITSRLKPCCMECGKPLIRVAYSTVEK